MEKKDAIAVFVPGLDATPGWTALTQTKRDWLLEKTSNVQQYRKMEGLGAIGAAVELVEIEAGLDGESMSMSNYLTTIFGQSARTAYRRMADYREMSKHWSAETIARMATHGTALLKGMSGVQLKTLVNVSKALPEPKSKEDKVIDAWIEEDVRKKIRSIKAARVKAIKPDEFEASKMAFNAVLRYLRIARLKTSAEQRRWLMRIVGWTMEAQAIHGTMQAGRISIPEGVIAKVGRPRKLAKKVA